MLTARTAVEDKVEGLRFADDYLIKPFHTDELAARIEVLLRRFQKNADVLEVKHLKIHTKDLKIIHKMTNEERLLTGKQYHLFQYFIRRFNQILTKEQLNEISISTNNPIEMTKVSIPLSSSLSQQLHSFLFLNFN